MRSLCTLFAALSVAFLAACGTTGPAPILFMSWAYQDKPEMTQQLAAEYIKAGKENNVLMVPAGLPSDMATYLRTVAWESAQAFLPHQGRTRRALSHPAHAIA